MSGQIFAALLSAALAAAPVQTAPAPAPSPAAPADDQAARFKRAEELFNNGERLYSEGSYEAAILAFQESYELSKEPSLLYNIGNAYERLGDFANARKYLDQYRAFAPEKEREALSRRIQNLDQRQREKEQRDAERAAQAADKPAAESQQVGPEPAPPTTPSEPPKRDRIYGPAAIALTAGAVVGLGIGIGFGIAAQRNRDAALLYCKDADGRSFCESGAETALRQQKTTALVADIGFAVAGAAAIALIAVVAAKAVKKKRNDQRAQLAPYAGPRGAGLTFGMRF